MSKEKDFVSEVIKAYLQDYQKKNNNDYEYDSDKLDKVNEIIARCRDMEDNFKCKIIRCMLEPKYEQSYVQVLFKEELAVNGEQLQNLINILQLCDGINITTNPVDDEWFEITFFVDNVWLKANAQ